MFNIRFLTLNISVSASAYDFSPLTPNVIVIITAQTMSKFMGVETVERERMNIAKRTFAAGAGFNYGTPNRIAGMGSEDRRPSY